MKRLKKLLYYFLLSDCVKCVDCKFDNKACNFYCKPPFGICIKGEKNETITT